MPVFYVNGDYVAAEDAALPITDLAILRGYGAFDYLRTYGGRPFRLLANIERLRRSCQHIYLDCPWSDRQIYNIVMETVRLNAFPEASIRILVTGGNSPDSFTPGSNPSLVVMVTPLRDQPAAWYRDGAKVVTIQMDRIVPGAKSINYIPAIMAMHHARAAGAMEALYVDAAGHVLEGTTTNLFIVQGGTLITPGETILPGITRNVVLELVQGVYPATIRSVSLEELYAADEAFITASNKQIVPVVTVDAVTVGRGTPGDHTRQIMALFRAETERTARGEDWQPAHL